MEARPRLRTRPVGTVGPWPGLLKVDSFEEGFAPMTFPAYALITGASSGIGECFAQSLAQRKQNLVLVARSRDKLDRLAGKLSRDYAIRTEVIDIDLSQPGSANRLANGLAERNLSIDLLVN